MFKNLTKKRLTVLLVSLSLILVVGVGVTLAYVFASTGNVVNTFTPSHVSCAVVEKIDGVTQAPVEGDEATGMTSTSVKSEVQIKNTGDTTAYIRAAIIVTWKKSDGTVYAKSPVAWIDNENPNDYKMDLNIIDNPDVEGWISGGDGYYYYTEPVLPVTANANNCYTGVLISQAVTFNNEEMNSQGYYVSIEIVASAIQSNLGNDAQSAWAEAAKGIN